MAQINQERENEFFRFFGRLEEEFIRELEYNATKGYYLNDSWHKAVKSLIHLRDRMYLGKDNAVNLGNNIGKCILWNMDYPILKKHLLKPDDVEARINDLFKGIECNIDMQSRLQQERYIYSLLKPFSKWCDGIIESKSDLLPSHIALNIDGNSFNESFLRARCISDNIHCNGPILGGCMFECTINTEDLDDGATKEDFQEVGQELRAMAFNVLLFRLIIDEVGQRLDALLLERGINLLWYQNQCSVQLVGKRNNIMALARYIGTPELVRKYIVEALPKIDDVGHRTASTPAQNAADIWSILPKELQIDEAKKIFERAIDAGFMTITSNGAKWNKEKQLLAYFASKMSDMFNLQKRVSDATGNNQISWKPFEEFFCVKDLRTARANCMKSHGGCFEPDKSKEIDKLFVSRNT